MRRFFPAWRGDQGKHAGPHSTSVCLRQDDCTGFFGRFPLCRGGRESSVAVLGGRPETGTRSFPCFVPGRWPGFPSSSSIQTPSTLNHARFPASSQDGAPHCPSSFILRHPGPRHLRPRSNRLMGQSQAPRATRTSSHALQIGGQFGPFTMRPGHSGVDVVVFQRTE